MVIKKSEIFTKIFENFRDNKQKSLKEVVDDLEESQLEKRQQEHDDEGSINANKQEGIDRMDDTEYYQNISNTPISAFEGFIQYLKVPDSQGDFYQVIINKRLQKTVRPIEQRNIRMQISNFQNSTDFSQLNTLLNGRNNVDDTMGFGAYKKAQEAYDRAGS